MLRLYARVNGILRDLFLEFLVGNVVELRARNGLRCVLNDAEFLRDGNGGILMVAGDHDRADARAAAFLDRRLDLRAHGVDHTR